MYVDEPIVPTTLQARENRLLDISGRRRGDPAANVFLQVHGRGDHEMCWRDDQRQANQ